jgi:hypothetical protein
LMRGGHRFSLATNAERVCAEIMLKQKDRAGWRFEEESSRSGLSGARRFGALFNPKMPSNHLARPLQHCSKQIKASD